MGGENSLEDSSARPGRGKGRVISKNRPNPKQQQKFENFLIEQQD